MSRRGGDEGMFLEEKAQAEGNGLPSTDGNPEPAPALSWAQGFIKDSRVIGGNGISMAASYTFSLEQFVMGLITLHLKGGQELAAASILAQSVMATAIRVALSPLFAISNHCSVLFGELRSLEEAGSDGNLLAQKRLEIANTFKAGILQSVIVSVPPFLFFLFAKSILVFFGQAASVAAQAESFLMPYSASTIALSVRMALGQIMYSKGDTKPPMYVGMVTFVIGTLLACWFAFGGFGLGRQGLPGIAWGYTIEAYLTVIAYATYVLKGRKYADLNLLSFVGCKWKDVHEKYSLLFKIGGPMAVTMIAETAMTFALSLFAGILGVEDQANLSYSMQVVFLVFVALMGFGQATALEVGRRKGAREYDATSRASKNGLLLTMCVVPPSCIAVIARPQLLYNVLEISERNQLRVSQLVPIVSCGALLQTARYNVHQVLRTLGDHKGSTVLSVFGMFSGVIIAGVVGLKTNLALYAIAAGLAIGEGLSFAGLLYRWCKRIQPEKIRQVTLDPTTAEPATWKKYIGSFFNCRSTPAVDDVTTPLRAVVGTADNLRNYS